MWIELTRPNGVKMLVNMSNFDVIAPGLGGFTDLEKIGDGDFVQTQETPEEIMQKIKLAQQEK